MSVCRECGCDLIVGDNWAPSAAKSRIRLCKQCKTVYDKQYRRDNSVRIKKLKKLNRQKNVRLMKRYLRFVGCQWPGCPIHDSDMLDAHAPKGHDDGVTASMMTGARKKLKKELRQNIVLCANHHRKLHALERRQEFDKIPRELRYGRN